MNGGVGASEINAHEEKAARSAAAASARTGVVWSSTLPMLKKAWSMLS